jgi:hypothetical protein
MSPSIFVISHQPEVSQFQNDRELAIIFRGLNQEILWLYIAMHQTILVQVRYARDGLVHDLFNLMLAK